MRELILERIETMRGQHSGFRGTMRWTGYVVKDIRNDVSYHL